MAELIKAFEFKVAAIKLIPSDGGRFEVTVDGDLVYSKLQTGSHVEPGALVEIVGEALRR
jgi:selenoprotein W-related protein